jgi:hypothetical protein
LYHQRPAEKKAANSSSRSADAGSVACTIVDTDSCSVLWAAVHEQIQTWPRVAVKRRIADSGPESGSKALSSTQLLLAQLVSGGSASNPLEVAKSMSHELMPKERAVNIAAVLARICQKREEEAEAARSVEGSINSRRVKDADGLRVIQARLRDDAGQVIDHSVGDGVAELKCVSLLIAKTFITQTCIVRYSSRRRFWPQALPAKGDADTRETRYVVVIVATADSDMLVEVVAHPLQSKYMIGSSGAPNSIITAYASAAAAAAIPELLKQIEAPCLKLCAFLATHCQVIWIVKRRIPMTLKPNPMRTARAPPFAHGGAGCGPRPDVRGCRLPSRSVPFTRWNQPHGCVNMVTLVLTAPVIGSCSIHLH